MVVENCVLCVAEFDTKSIGRERALVAGGIGVACVGTPEAAVSYVKNSPVRVVLIDDAVAPEVSRLAGALKVASPDLRIIALTSSKEELLHVDAVLQKPIDLQALLRVVQQNLEPRGSSANA